MCLFGLGTRWYDVDSLLEVNLDDASAAGGTVVTIDAPIDKIPVFQRGGTIVPRKMRTRRSSKLMKYGVSLQFSMRRWGGAPWVACAFTVQIY